jgi:hypothetical protein
LKFGVRDDHAGASAPLLQPLPARVLVVEAKISDYLSTVVFGPAANFRIEVTTNNETTA